MHGKNSTTGIGLVEAYDLDESIGITLTNVSTRSFVDTHENVMIGGFISGDVMVRVIVRALGPTLSAFGAPNGTGGSDAGVARSGRDPDHL